SPYDGAREGVGLTKKLLRGSVRSCQGGGSNMVAALPLFLGLNDKTVTDIPKTAQKQRHMTSIAPKAANPGRWVEMPRLPIPTGEHAVIECQGKIHII